MKLVQVNYQDSEDQQIKDVTVKMTVNEALAIVNIAGRLNGHAQKKLRLEAGESIYDCLDQLFNAHYEDGYPNLGISLETLNGGK